MIYEIMPWGKLFAVFAEKRPVLLLTSKQDAEALVASVNTEHRDCTGAASRHVEIFKSEKLAERPDALF